MSASKVAVVTGGDQGLGRTTAVALARSGWDIAFSYIRDEGPARSLEKEIESIGRRVWSARADAGISIEVESFYAGVDEHFGSCATLLVNNAGVQTWSSLLDLKEESWDLVIRTNLKGCFLNTQAAAKRVIRDRKRGTIINIGSACNKVPFPKLVDYTASKGGIEQFTKVSAVELGPYGINVNCVAPGPIETERTRREAPNYAETWSRVTPMRRVGTAEDVAHAVLFFADERSDFISGQTLYVDGGAFTVTNWPY
jgi:NAD(P)-dependent dehydrogenase (short-subunit alcohol dehydrogenase family)